MDSHPAGSPLPHLDTVPRQLDTFDALPCPWSECLVALPSGTPRRGLGPEQRPSALDDLRALYGLVARRARDDPDTPEAQDVVPPGRPVTRGVSCVWVGRGGGA